MQVNIIVEGIHTNVPDMFNKTRFNKRKPVQKKVWDGFLQRTHESFHLYALISTKFELDKNHSAPFGVKTT